VAKLVSLVQFIVANAVIGNRLLEVFFNTLQESKELLFFGVAEALVEGSYEFFGDFAGELVIFLAFFGKAEDFVALVVFVGKDLNEAGIF